MKTSFSAAAFCQQATAAVFLSFSSSSEAPSNTPTSNENIPSACHLLFAVLRFFQQQIKRCQRRIHPLLLNLPFFFFIFLQFWSFNTLKNVSPSCFTTRTMCFTHSFFVGIWESLLDGKN
ncbi:hypothetical protein CEXT_567941 [Caerostris extrusa]|uniref:Secreted protein n=1 Tax=Caerostris extrusa TaxID=172846 RepID=A0AAV4PWB2_CAEEX|nr:hypothetical protein CEXT_567941 [Caerostris extrusa]